MQSNPHNYLGSVNGSKDGCTCDAVEDLVFGVSSATLPPTNRVMEELPYGYDDV